MKSLAFVALCLCLLTSCATSGVVVYEDTGNLVIPEGYTLVAASAYGVYGNNVSFYCQSNGNGSVYDCSGGVIGQQIPIPAGYRLVAASAHGSARSAAEETPGQRSVLVGASFLRLLCTA